MSGNSDASRTLNDEVKEQKAREGYFSTDSSVECPSCGRSAICVSETTKPMIGYIIIDGYVKHIHDGMAYYHLEGDIDE